MPKISVIMPAYNAEKYIGEAIDSILSQTYRDFELIVLNDCSKDGTESVILSYEDSRIVYVKNEENLGVARTLNKGLALARGEYIARMDADDISMRSRFEKQVAFLDANEKVAVVGSAVERFSEKGSLGVRTFAQTPETMAADLFFACGLAHPSVMMRAAVIRELGGYDPDFEGMEDYALWCRVGKTHGIAALPQVLLRYRVHEKQVTQNPSEKYKARMTRLKESQLEALGLSTEDMYAQSYYRYCLGEKPQGREEVGIWCAFLEKAAAADPEKEGCFRRVAMNGAAQLPMKDALAVCRECGLLSPVKLLAEKGKRRIRRLRHG